MPESRTSPRRIGSVKKATQALELRTSGHTYDEIARTLGYKTASGALYAVEKALDRVPAPEVGKFRKLNLVRLNKILQVWWPVMETGVTEVDGETITHSFDDRLKATDRVLRTIADIRSLFGLDMAKPVPGSSPESPMHVAPVFTGDLTDEQVDALIALDDQMRKGVIDQEGNSISPRL